MLTIIIIMASGIAIGRLLRNRSLRFLPRITNVLIWILLFLLGIEVGGDDRIVKGIASLGAEAVAVSVAGVAGCCLLTRLLWKWANHRKEADEK